MFSSKNLGVALLAVGAIIFCWVLLLAMSAAPSGAQVGGGGTTGSTIGSTNALNDDDQNRNRRVIIIEEPTVEERTIIVRTIPRKPLPPTGGSAVYAMIGGSVLTGAGLLTVGIAMQRGRQR